VNSSLLRPTRPCAQHVPRDGHPCLCPWVVGMAAMLFFATFHSAQGVSISGIIWLDKNQNGLIDFPELAIPGARIDLYEQNNPDTILATTYSNGVGEYQFSGLEPGTYIIHNTDPGPTSCHLMRGLIFDVNGNPTSTGSGTVDSANIQFKNIEMTYGEQGRYYNFGDAAFPTALISPRLTFACGNPIQPANVENVPEPGVGILLGVAGGFLLLAWKIRKRRPLST
jgi:hypothetical protein